METLFPISAVCPITMPVPWSMRMPFPNLAWGCISIEKTYIQTICDMSKVKIAQMNVYFLTLLQGGLQEKGSRKRTTILHHCTCHSHSNRIVTPICRRLTPKLLVEALMEATVEARIQNIPQKPWIAVHEPKSAAPCSTAGWLCDGPELLGSPCRKGQRWSTIHKQDPAAHSSSALCGQKLKYLTNIFLNRCAQMETTYSDFTAPLHQRALLLQQH